MKIISWNMRGIGGANKSGCIRKWVRHLNVDFLGLIETKSGGFSDQFVTNLWGSDDVKWAEVGAVERSGGILCMWDSNFLTEENIIRGDRWVCVCGFVQDMQMKVAICTIYGFHDSANKTRMWQELLEIRERLDRPMLIMGDFNEIRHIHERKGCSSRTRSMDEFHDWISAIGLIDMPLVGRKFTWRRGNSCSKLDRVLIDPVYLQKFESLSLSGINCSLSNHVPLIVQSKEINWGPKPFRSLDTWFSHSGFVKLVEEEWKGFGSMDFLEKLKNLKNPIKR